MSLLFKSATECLEQRCSGRIGSLIVLNETSKKAKKSRVRYKSIEDKTVTEMFVELIQRGKIVPVGEVLNMRLPGEYEYVPSIVTYGTPDVSLSVEVIHNAQLGHRT